MKLIINISEEVYKNIQSKSTEIQAEGYTVENAILNGIPLEQIRKEIEQSKKVHEELGDVFKAHNVAIDRVLQIIDKYMKGDTK